MAQSKIKRIDTLKIEDVSDKISSPFPMNHTAFKIGDYVFFICDLNVGNTYVANTDYESFFINQSIKPKQTDTKWYYLSSQMIDTNGKVKARTSAWINKTNLYWNALEVSGNYLSISGFWKV